MQSHLRISKILIYAIFLLCSFKVSASSCQELAKIAENSSGIATTKYTYTVQGKKGFRTYFHSGPSAKCKIKDLFIIPKDNVIAYSYYKYENKNWMYIMYMDKNGKYPFGWVLEKDFRQDGTINTPKN